jgi:organic radical activating enzyme
MKIKGLVDEDFVNFKLPCMFISIGTCNWKCCIEINIPVTVCQNSDLAKQKDIDIPIDEIFNRYISNPISEAIVIGGLEPMMQFEDIYDLIKYFRDKEINDTFVIYTGYYPDEIQDKIEKLKSFKNIICKFGRYVPNQEKHFDEVLGVNLVSDNQYGEVIS